MAPLVFACERSGLVGALLGGYDGAGSWRVFVEHVDDKDEHMVVQIHEAMHHELQTSTSWGALVAMAGVLAKLDLRRHALLEVFDRGVELSTIVHELYATVLSTSIARQRSTADPLAGNPRYQAYRDRAEALLPDGPGIDSQVRYAAIAAVLRCCMQPSAMVSATARLDFDDLSAGALGYEGPDHRLALFEAANPTDEWRRLLAVLTSADPGYQQRILAERRPTEGDDMAALTAQWEFETKVVQRRCYELTARVLETQGASSIPWPDLDTISERIVAAAGSAHPHLAETVRLAADRPLDAGADVLEFSRQAIALRSPLQLQVAGTDTASTLAMLDGFVVQAGTEHEHVCALWGERAVLAKQFDCPPLPELDAVFFTRSHDETGVPVARIGILDSGSTPQELRRLIRPRPLLALTTHYSLTHDSTMRSLRHTDPVYVLMDLPIGWHIDDWVRQGATIRYAVATVDAEKELAVIVMTVDRASNFRFFHVGGLLALGSLFERLRQRHDPAPIIYDDAVMSESVAGISLAINHVVHTFQVLDQDGVE